MFTPIPPQDGSAYDSVSAENKTTTIDIVQNKVKAAFLMSDHIEKTRAAHPELMKDKMVGEGAREKTLFLFSSTNHISNFRKSFFFNAPETEYVVTFEGTEKEDDYSVFRTDKVDRAVEHYNCIEV